MRLSLAGLLLALCAGLLTATLQLALPAVATAQASILAEVDNLRRQKRYQEAQALLDPLLDTLSGEERARGLFLLARLSSDHKEVRRLLRESVQATQDEELRFAGQMALARLDYARGNYNSVRTRLRVESRAEAQLLVAQANIGLDQAQRAEQELRAQPAGELQSLLLGWCVRQVGDPQGALTVLDRLSQDKTLASSPTALLWKAECEAELGLRDRSLQTAAMLQNTYPNAPEAVLIEPTLATLRRQAQTEPTNKPRGGRVVLQLGAFEDRANALRFRDGLPRSIQPLFVEEVRTNARRWYRVHVGPFETRDVAEDYAREHLDPLNLDWRLSRPEEQ
jgi:tetratricopeptide (TPR) repeat protein